MIGFQLSLSRVVVPDVALLSQTSASRKLVIVKTKVNNSDEEARNEYHEMATTTTNNPVDDRRNKVIISIIDNHDNEMPPWINIVVTVCVFVRHLFSWYQFYFDFHSARIIFDVSSCFYLWNINNTKADICKKW